MFEINFCQLTEDDLPLLLKWLEHPHVKAWWDQDVNWTSELAKNKYSSYIKGYKIEEGTSKKLDAFTFSLNEKKIGYIQLYNAYEFPRENGIKLENLPNSLAAIDYFIGDPAYIGKRYSSLILSNFLKKYVDPYYDACFVDPDENNIKAIKSYEKAGFSKRKAVSGAIWMVRPAFDRLD